MENVASGKKEGRNMASKQNSSTDWLRELLSGYADHIELTPSPAFLNRCRKAAFEALAMAPVDREVMVGAVAVEFEVIVDPIRIRVAPAVFKKAKGPSSGRPRKKKDKS
ncbi:hypothetical protein LCGC14_2229000 [marine sediment metagenome]|uniref:Uncharacterized protein n=1 Tax=marine sediment metagenome TaxID=412755 RepID=A0A0F9D8R0_9ZZZZ